MLISIYVMTIVFQANTNAALKNLETQVGQLALAMQNLSKDAFSSDTGKNSKDCMAVTLRSGRELKKKRNEKKETEEEKHAKVGEELKQHGSEVAEEDRTTKMQQEQQVEKGNLRKNEEIKAYSPQVPFP